MQKISIENTTILVNDNNKSLTISGFNSDEEARLFTLIGDFTENKDNQAFICGAFDFEKLHWKHH